MSSSSYMSCNYSTIDVGKKLHLNIASNLQYVLYEIIIYGTREKFRSFWQVNNIIIFE